MDSNNDWRAQFPANSRQNILEKIIEVLAKTIPHNGEEGLQNVKRIAVQFEGMIYNAAPSQTDYIRAISRKMLTMEAKSQISNPNLGKIMQLEIQDQLRTGPGVESSQSQLISPGVSNANLNPVQNFVEPRGMPSSNFANSQRRLQQHRGKCLPPPRSTAGRHPHHLQNLRVYHETLDFIHPILTSASTV